MNENLELRKILELLDREVQEYEQFKRTLDTSGILAIDLKICALTTFRKKLVAMV